VVRDRIIDRWIDSTKQAYEQGAKRVYYLSLEFLIGRLMRERGLELKDRAEDVVLRAQNVANDTLVRVQQSVPGALKSNLRQDGAL